MRELIRRQLETATIPEIEKKSAKVSATTLAEITPAFEQYVKVVLASGLSDNSKDTYVTTAENFLRWLIGEFEPGSKVGMPMKRKRRRSPANFIERE